MNPLLDPIMEIAKIWGELIEAYHGVNSFGGHVAEIYAYRFQMYNPSAHSEIKIRDRVREVNEKSGLSLYHILKEFEEYVDCKIRVNDIKFGRWVAMRPFDYRYQIEIIHDPPNTTR